MQKWELTLTELDKSGLRTSFKGITNDLKIHLWRSDDLGGVRNGFLEYWVFGKFIGLKRSYILFRARLFVINNTGN